MNEVKKCSLSGVAFTMDVEAYETLSAYLESLKNTYKDSPTAQRSSPTSRPASRS